MDEEQIYWYTITPWREGERGRPGGIGDRCCFHDETVANNRQERKSSSGRFLARLRLFPGHYSLTDRSEQERWTSELDRERYKSKRGSKAFYTLVTVLGTGCTISNFSFRFKKEKSRGKKPAWQSHLWNWKSDNGSKPCLFLSEISGHVMFEWDGWRQNVGETNSFVYLRDWAYRRLLY